MIFTPLPLKGAFLIQLDKKEDNRGFFARFYCKEEFEKQGLDTNLVQMNTSFTKRKGTIRGFHFQSSPKTETKVVRCIHGAIWDVIVDIRAGSTTYGKWYGAELNWINRTMMYIPKGFAHGFQTLTDDVDQLYLHSEFYSPEHEGGLIYNDPVMSIRWPLPVTEISPTDQSHPLLEEITPIIL